MENLLAQIYLSYKALFLWLNWPAYLSTVVLRPMLFVTMFALAGRFAGQAEAAQAYILGMATFSLAEILLGGIIQTFSYERAFGTLPLLLASPASRTRSYFTRAGLHYPNGLLSFALSTGFALAFLGLDTSRVDGVAALAAIFAGSLSATTFALLVANIAVLYRNWTFVFSISSSVVLLLTGILIPVSALPSPLQALAAILPLTHALEALRSAFGGDHLSVTSSLLGWEVALAVLYGAIGLLAFRAIELQARRSGALQTGI